MKTIKLLDTFAQDGFYLTQGYGVNASYYSKFGLLWHEGIDLGHKNKKIVVRSPITGVVIQDIDTTKNNYGKYVVIWDSVQKCAIWICHLDTNLVSAGQKIKAGDPIGEMGGTGNTNGEHIHFNFVMTDEKGNRLYKQKTKNLGFIDPQYPLDPNPPKYPTGIPEYKVIWEKTVLKGESPQESMPEKYSEEEMTQVRLDRDKNWNFYQEEVKKVEAKEEVIKKLKDEHNSFIERIANLIGSPIDENSIIEFCTRFNSSLDTALGFEDKYNREVQERKKDYLIHQEELKKFSNQIDIVREDLQKQLDTMQVQLNQAIHTAEVAEQALKTATKFASFWKWAVSLKGNNAIKNTKN